MQNKKYERIAHLPHSPGGTRDDLRLAHTRDFTGKRVVITEKMDGSNLGETCKDIFARSHNGPPTHKSFDLAKATHAALRHLIPEGVTVFSEWCFARHSIEYNALPGYRLIFGARDDLTGTHWAWDEVARLAERLAVPTVPVLWRGLIRRQAHLSELVEYLTSQDSACGVEREGVVVRVEDEISNESWPVSIAKWVRPHHVQTDEHWLNQPIVRNRLAKP